MGGDSGTLNAFAKEPLVVHWRVVVPAPWLGITITKTNKNRNILLYDRSDDNFV